MLEWPPRNPIANSSLSILNKASALPFHVRPSSSERLGKRKEHLKEDLFKLPLNMFLFNIAIKHVMESDLLSVSLLPWLKEYFLCMGQYDPSSAAKLALLSQGMKPTFDWRDTDPPLPLDVPSPIPVRLKGCCSDGV